MTTYPNPGATDINQLLAQVPLLIRQGNIEGARHTVRTLLSAYPATKGPWHDWWLLLNPGWADNSTGSRLRLRGMTTQDTPFIYGCFTNDAFMQLFHPTAPRQRSSETIARQLAHAADSMARSKAQHWLVERLNGEALGLISVTNLVVIHRRAELLVGFPDTASHGTGLATEACLLALDVCFNSVGLHKLTTMVFANNQHSQLSTTALGFEQEGLRREHLRDPKTGLFVDCYENGLTLSSFRTNSRLSRLSVRLLKRDITKPT